MFVAPLADHKRLVANPEHWAQRTDSEWFGDADLDLDGLGHLTIDPLGRHPSGRVEPTMYDTHVEHFR
jgi:hypothetical protein